MRCFICEKKVIDNIVTLYLRGCGLDIIESLAKKMGNMWGLHIWQINYQSYIDRYSSSLKAQKEYLPLIQEMNDLSYEYVASEESDAQLVKSFDCWLYQSCESDKDSENGKEYLAMRGLISGQVKRRFPDTRLTPEYLNANCSFLKKGLI